MDFQNKFIHVAIAFDRNYLLPFYALASSIFHNNKGTLFNFHCIVRGISEMEKQEINDYLKRNNSSINFYEIDEQLISGFITINHWNTTVYYKIFFPLLVGEAIERILYLDTDTLVVNSLVELYDMDLRSYPVAAVKDTHVGKEVYSELHEREDYFNSGVMLIDIKKWNLLNVSQEALKFLTNHPEKITYVDQDALNVVLENKCILISSNYNFTYTHVSTIGSGKELKQILSTLVIIHFTMNRPWHFLCKNRFRGLYKFYLRKSPMRGSAAITDFSFPKIPSYLKMRMGELYSDLPLAVKKKIRSMRRIFNLLKVITISELLQIATHHLFTKKLATNNPLLHRLVVFAIACTDNHISLSKHSKELLLLRWQNKDTRIQFYVRKYSRDLLVFMQFFTEKEYFIEYIKPLKIKFTEEFIFIIDSGANIGCSAIYFHLLFPNAKIVCIEPEESNFKLLKKNIQINNALAEIIPLQMAVWNEVTELELMQRDWSHDAFHVMKKPIPDQVISKIGTTTFPQLMQEFGYGQIDLLKIDIEGAEQTIFKDDAHWQLFIPKTKRLIIEVHDEFISAQKLCDLLENAHFECKNVTLSKQPDVVIAYKKSLKSEL